MKISKTKYHNKLAEYFASKDFFLESIKEQRERAKRLPPSPRPVNTRKVVELPFQRIQSQNWDEVENLFTELHFLESKTEVGKVFDLANDFSFAIKNIPSIKPKNRNLSLLYEALRRDIHFISDHPTTFFQCMWNLCWWYDCNEIASHYKNPEDPEIEISNPIHPKGSRLCELLEKWRFSKKELSLNPLWVRSCLPPPLPLGGPLIGQIRSDSICHCSWSMDGKLIVTASREKCINIWDALTFEQIKKIDVNSLVYHVAFAPDSKRLAVTGKGAIDIIDIETGILLRSINEEHASGRIKFEYGFKWSPDGLRLAAFVSIDSRQHVIVWDYDGKPIASLDTKQDTHTPGSLSWSPDGSYLAVAIWNRILIWNLESNTSTTIYEANFDLKHIAWSFNGQHIVWGSNNGIIIYDSIKGELLDRLRGKYSSVESIAWSPDGSRIAWSSESELNIWDTNTFLLIAVSNVNHDRQKHIAWAPDGQRIASIGESHTLRVWAAESNSQKLNPGDFISWPNCIVYSPDGRLIATKYYRGTYAKIWDAETGAMVTSIPNVSELIFTPIAFSPDSTKFVACNKNQESTARIWNTANGTEVACLFGHEAEIKCLSFSPDGKKIATASNDQTIRVWDTRSGDSLAIWQGTPKYVGYVIWSPNGQTIACWIDGSNSEETNTWFWCPESGIELKLEKEMIINKVRFSSDEGHLIGSGFAERNSQLHPIIRTWDTNTGACLNEQKGSIDMVDLLAGIPQPLLEVVARGIDPVIKLSDSETIVAWYNIQLARDKGDYAIPSPTGSSWVIPINGLNIISLENWDETR